MTFIKKVDSSLCYDVIITHQNFKIDNLVIFRVISILKLRWTYFRDDISLIINQCHLQATEGSLRRTQSVRQTRSASKRSALVIYKLHFCNSIQKKSKNLKQCLKVTSSINHKIFQLPFDIVLNFLIFVWCCKHFNLKIIIFLSILFSRFPQILRTICWFEKYWLSG